MDPLCCLFHFQNQQRDSNRGRGRRKRGHLTKSDIRQKPFFLQDGDLVGVIDRVSLCWQLTGQLSVAICEVCSSPV